MKKLSLIIPLLILISFFAGCYDDNSSAKNKVSHLIYTVDGESEKNEYFDEWGFSGTGFSQYQCFWFDYTTHSFGEARIYLPSNVTSGCTYSGASDSFLFKLRLTDADSPEYYSNPSQIFSLTVDEWASDGSVFRGHFSGTLKGNCEELKLITITGIFESFKKTN